MATYTIPTKTYIDNQDALKAPLNSPALTGTPTAPTASTTTSTTQLATTAFATPRTATTGAAVIPAGTTAQRPDTPSNGYLRYNTDLGTAEIYSNGTWGSVGGGATGGDGDQVFMENEYTITTSYMIPAGKSAVTVGDSNGDVHFNAGVEVTFEDVNSRWVVL